MTTLGVLLVAVALLVAVFYWSGRYGGRGRERTISLRRTRASHVTSRGRPKVAYAKRADAEVQARFLAARDGASMDVYRCPTCSKWHVGHVN
ncbi:MAG TPA: hypothetical protein VMV53_06190 [Acidimicrobiales bacterium]|nr:hypothetical protein [Acidimicrobiales bacterium]